MTGAIFMPAGNYHAREIPQIFYDSVRSTPIIDGIFFAHKIISKEG
jgi:hypothetical protein